MIVNDTYRIVGYSIVASRAGFSRGELEVLSIKGKGVSRGAIWHLSTENKAV